MTTVTLDDGTRSDVLTVVGPVLLAVHNVCRRLLLKINPDRKEWFCFGCRQSGIVQHVEQETTGELGEAR